MTRLIDVLLILSTIGIPIYIWRARARMRQTAPQRPQ